MPVTDSGVDGGVSIRVFGIDVDAGLKQLWHTLDIICNWKGGGGYFQPIIAAEKNNNVQ